VVVAAVAAVVVLVAVVVAVEVVVVVILVLIVVIVVVTKMLFHEFRTLIHNSWNWSPKTQGCSDGSLVVDGIALA
jgi:hypothetical protein